MALEALCREVVRGCTNLLKTPVDQDIPMRKLELSVLAPATRLLDEHYKTLRKYPSVAQQYAGRAATTQENRYEELREALGGLLSRRVALRLRRAPCPPPTSSGRVVQNLLRSSPCPRRSTPFSQTTSLTQ
jgi:hypothetical protein